MPVSPLIRPAGQPACRKPVHRARLALRRALLLLLFIGVACSSALALQGNVGAHDPSTIVKDGNKYWVFHTGPGIQSKYSTDLVHWTASRSVFTTATRPNWITAKVPAFVNEYWAPECIFMNGKFYLYYSCSTFGSKVSGMGLATNVTLDPASPNYRWVDEGEVISSNNASASNAIDPAVYRDASNNLWFIYGSFFGGIRILQLDAATGKPLNGASTPQVAVADGDVEAAYVKQHNGFYYLFINRGACCRGVNSTYYIQVGRSASPTGPFLDKNGVNLNNKGGTLLLNVSGRYTGPGHAGIFEENGVSYFSHHYYDYEDGGAPKLGIANLTWDATGWPAVSRDWMAPGRYEIASQNSGLLWQTQACAGTAGQTVVQAARSGQACQQWDFVAVGDGEYRIVTALNALTVGTNICSAANGAGLELGANANLSCQLVQINRASDGTMVFASVNGNRVVEVPSAATAPGVQLALFNYNGCACQRWFLTAAGGLLATGGSQKLAGVNIYPVPAERGTFTVDLGTAKSADATTVQVFNSLGQLVYRRLYNASQAQLSVAAGLAPGIYQVQVQRGQASITQKQTVQ